MEGSDLVISVTGIEDVTIGRPGDRHGVGRGVNLGVSGGQGDTIDGLLRLQIPDGDVSLGGSAQPVSSGRESHSVDDITSLELVELFTLRQVPEDSITILTTRGTERTIRGDGDAVEVTLVSIQSGDSGVVSSIQVDNLHEAIPTGGNHDGVGGRESYTGNPLGVSVFGHLALTEGVPNTYSVVSSTRGDLSVVMGEGNRQDISSVSVESSSGSSSGDFPQSEGTIPRTRESILTIRGDGDVAHEVVVSSQRTNGGSVVLDGVSGEAPNHNSLVTRSRQDHVGVLGSGGDGGYPSSVSSEYTSEGELVGRDFSHDS